MIRSCAFLTYSLLIGNVALFFWTPFARAADPAQMPQVESQPVRETRLAKDGKRYIKFETGNETFLLEILQPDPDSPDAYRCVSHDGRRVQEGTYLVTGNAHVSEKATVFLAAIREKCNEGKMLGDVGHLKADAKLGIEWKDSTGTNSRQIYTQPLSPAPNLGFSTQF